LQPIQIQNGQTHKFTQGRGHDSELSREQIFPNEPLALIDVVMPDDAADYIHDSEGVANLSINVFDISVFGQHMATRSLLQKVDAIHIVTFEVDVLVDVVDHWLEQRANPCEKRAGLILKEL
jgi:hypothetical protein